MVVNLRVPGFRYRRFQVAGTGLELPPENAGNPGNSLQSGAECGALSGQEAPFDPELRAVVDAWPALPEALRAFTLRHRRYTTPVSARRDQIAIAAGSGTAAAMGVTVNVTVSDCVHGLADSGFHIFSYNWKVPVGSEKVA